MTSHLNPRRVIEGISYELKKTRVKFRSQLIVRVYSKRYKMYAQLLGLLLFACQIILNGSSVVRETINSDEGETSTARPTTLPEGYVSFPEDHAAYKIYNRGTTWNQARDRCNAEGARLAITDTVDKIRHINTLHREGFNWLHVGIHRLGWNEEWIRIDNGLPVASVPWKASYPRGNGNCAGISVNFDALVDYQCDKTIPEYYVCEIVI